MLAAPILKLVSLVILTFQTTAFVLVARQSRKVDADGGVYFAGTAVFYMELSKLLVSTLMVFVGALEKSRQMGDHLGYAPLGHNTHSQPPRTLVLSSLSRCKDLLWSPSAFWLAVPSSAYVAQNNLQLLAASYLEPALFQTFTQIKLITTAIFSVILVKRTLLMPQWASILLLVVGLAVVHQSAEKKPTQALGALPTEGDSNNVTIGLLLMIGASILSGFAGVFTERILKQDNDFWATNFHMSIFSLVPAGTIIVAAYIRDAQFHMMHNFGGWAWATVFLNAFGGLVVSMVLKYADSIAKGFSLASAVLLTVVINTAFFGATFTFSCMVGILAVFLSTLLYIFSTNAAKKTVEVQAAWKTEEDVSVYEKEKLILSP